MYVSSCIFFPPVTCCLLLFVSPRSRCPHCWIPGHGLRRNTLRFRTVAQLMSGTGLHAGSMGAPLKFRTNGFQHVLCRIKSHESICIPYLVRLQVTRKFRLWKAGFTNRRFRWSQGPMRDIAAAQCSETGRSTTRRSARPYISPKPSRTNHNQHFPSCPLRSGTYHG